MKTAQVVGRLGRGIETKVLPSGSSVAEFDLAVGAYDFSKKEKDTYWISCVVFGQTADFLAQYAEPGDTIAIAGELRLEKYHSKKYTDDEGNGAPMTRFTIVADMGKAELFSTSNKDRVRAAAPSGDAGGEQQTLADAVKDGDLNRDDFKDVDFGEDDIPF